jgi:tRNA pseudouridine55 synthase
MDTNNQLYIYSKSILDKEVLSHDRLAEGVVLLVDKPKGISSFGAITYLKRNLNFRKFGHAGTLDPLASGLLIICSGKYTKQLESFVGQKKGYTTEFILGGTTRTYDSEFPPENLKNVPDISIEKIQETINSNFIGEIEQIPPVFSAIKINGRRAYDLARKNQNFEMKSRQVIVDKFEITSLERVKIEGHNCYKGTATINCSKGTYIRSLIYDLGQEIGCGGYIKELRRTKIGKYNVEKTIKIT